MCELTAQEPRALSWDLWVGDHRIDLLQLEQLPAIRQCLTVSRVSPTICTSPASSASRSSVTLMEPSSEFSIGTIAHSTSPWRSAMIVS